MTLTLDTSGTVPVQVTPASHQNVGWIDLDAFTQGYVEAAFASEYRDGKFATAMKARRRDMRLPGFSDLAPDTLAAMMADCEAFQTLYGEEGDGGADGEKFWKTRQLGWWRETGFTVTTLYLSEDGLIHHREAS